jgi:prepilin-type N-terminal cleavage/methylation domain-containing protein
MKAMSKKGYTLIEVLVVIIIVGLLATGIRAFYVKSIQDAKISQAQLEMKEIATALHLGSINLGNTIREVTGSGCSDCICRGIDNLAILEDAHPCVQNWERLLTRVAGASEFDITDFERDPWGSPYLVDENEGEVPTHYCRRDTFHSAGPDRKAYTQNDISWDIPFYDSACN